MNEDVGRCSVVAVLFDMCLQADAGKPLFAGVVTADLDLYGLEFRIEQVDAGDILGDIIELVSKRLVAPRCTGIVYGILRNVSVNNDICMGNVSVFMIRADIRIAHLSEEVIQRGARIVLLHIVCNALDLVICKAAGSGFCNDILDMTDGFRLFEKHDWYGVVRLAGVIDRIVAEAPCSVFEPVVDEVIIVVPLKILISGNAGRNGIERIIVVGGEIDLIPLERVVGCKVIGIQLWRRLLQTQFPNSPIRLRTILSQPF